MEKLNQFLPNLKFMCESAQACTRYETMVLREGILKGDD